MGWRRRISAAAIGTDLGPIVPIDTVGILLLLKAFSAGCSALIGVEAIAIPMYGVAALAILAATVLIVVDAETHRLLPVYAVGVSIGYVRNQTRKGRQVTVLLAQVEANRWWHRPLHNPRGPVLATALRARTDAVIATLAVRLD